MKRILLIFIMITSLILPASAVYAADDGITVLVNGVRVESDAPAMNVSGSTMLPFRAIFNALGVGDDAIKWNPNSRSIEVRKGNTYIFLVIGSTGALINDKLITLNAAPYIENGRTYIPVRFVSEALGAGVDWDKTTKTVKITNK